MDGWMGGWMDGWMGGWMSGWVDGWMDGYHIMASVPHLNDMLCCWYMACTNLFNSGVGW